MYPDKYPDEMIIPCWYGELHVKMIDQGSSELNIIIGVKNEDFEVAIKAIYDIFVLARI